MDIYRKCSAVFLKNHGSEDFFAAERIDIPGAWQIPQGGVEEGETHLEGAIRELYEETAVSSIKLLKNTATLYKYDFPADIRADFKQKSMFDYKGQEVRFFLFEFLGNDSEIDLQGVFQREFSCWRWMTMVDIINSAVYFKKEVYKAAAINLGLY